MKLLSTLAILSLVCLTACTTTPPEPQAQFRPVPGPSTTNAALPPAPVPEPQPAPTPTPAAKPRKEQPAPKTPTPIVTPDTSLIGKVVRYNETGRFAVLEFPVARMPQTGQKLFVYRNTLKVGELKVTGPQRDDRTVADVTTGTAQAGDEVREQ